MIQHYITYIYWMGFWSHESVVSIFAIDSTGRQWKRSKIASDVSVDMKFYEGTKKSRWSLMILKKMVIDSILEYELSFNGILVSRNSVNNSSILFGVAQEDNENGSGINRDL